MNLNQVSLPAIDLGASIEFFRTLGLTLIVETGIYARFECLDGDATMSLHKIDTAPPGNGVCVYFECDGLDRRVEALITTGLTFDSAPQDMRWLWRETWLNGSDGQQDLPVQAGINRKNPPWRRNG